MKKENKKAKSKHDDLGEENDFEEAGAFDESKETTGTVKLKIWLVRKASVQLLTFLLRPMDQRGAFNIH